MSKQPKIVAQLQAAAKGLTTALPTGTVSLKVGAQTFTIPDLGAKIASYQAFFDAVTSAHVSYSTSVDAKDAAVPEIRQFLTDLKDALVHLLGGKSPELTQFGVTPRKTPTKLTAEERSLANARARNTRDERGTLGSRQKAAVQAPVVKSLTIGTPQQAAANGTKPPATT